MKTEEMNALIQLSTQLSQLQLSIEKIDYRLDQMSMRINHIEPHTPSINEADEQLRDFFN
jgi:hypothetical protein